MCYWDYMDIMETANTRAKRASGERVVKEVPQSNKDMIQRTKELMNK